MAKKKTKTGTIIQDVQIGIMSDLHATAVLALANAALENAKAIADIARKTAVYIETGISINKGSDA